jgi:opacity protein-like surface antigen
MTSSPARIANRMFRLPVALFALALAGLAASGAAAQDIKRLGEFDHWRAFTYTENGNRVCYMASEPVKEEGDYDRRGDVYAMVTHQPARGSKDVVSFVIGYPFKDQSRVAVNIDGSKKFTLFTHEDTAWAADKKTDTALVRAMKRGREMVVEGVSNKGTETTDTYSLFGFTDAHNAIDEACGV